MLMKRLLFALAAVLMAAMPAARGQTPTGREIMEAYKAQDRTEDTSVEMSMTLRSARGGTRHRQLTLRTKTHDDGTQMQLIRFLSPADVEGTGFLAIEHLDREDDTWLYLPALRKTRRVAGTDKQDRFVGTDFSYEDLEAEKLDSHAYLVVGSETVGGYEAWIIEATPTHPKKAAETAYSKRELWVSKDHGLILQAKYYGKDGSYAKRLQADDVRQVPGSAKWRAFRLVMEDVVKGGKTVLELSAYRIDEGVSADFFSQRYLKRGV